VKTLSLSWVRQNASAFGGDVNNVTIMGESAGAMCCFLHLVSPLSRGLFHKMIAMSGSASTPFMRNDRKPSVFAEAMAKQLGAKPGWN
jgi:carboxylesterase type B